MITRIEQASTTSVEFGRRFLFFKSLFWTWHNSNKTDVLFLFNAARMKFIVWNKIYLWNSTATDPSQPKPNVDWHWPLSKPCRIENRRNVFLEKKIVWTLIEVEVEFDFLLPRNEIVRCSIRSETESLTDRKTMMKKKQLPLFFQWSKKTKEIDRNSTRVLLIM